MCVAKCVKSLLIITEDFKLVEGVLLQFVQVTTDE